MNQAISTAEKIVLNSPSSSRPGPYRLFFLSVAVLCACILLFVGLLWSGIAAGTGFELRYDSIFLPFIVAALFFGLAKAPCTWTGPGLVLLSVTLCGMVLSGTWTSAVSDHSRLAGILPYSDSFSYFDGFFNLIHYGELTEATSRRPLSPAVGTVLFFISLGNVKAVLALMVFLVALTLPLPVREMIRTHGWIAGYVMFLALFLFYRRFIGTALTEHMGLAFGCLAFTLFWRSAHDVKKNAGLALAGLFILALGLFARAGAFFILPALIIWIGLTWHGSRRFSFRYSLFACAAVGAALSLNLVVYHSIGHSGASTIGNFPYVLYGLTNNGNWTKILVDRPDVRLLSENERNQMIYDLALKQIIERPFSLVEGAARAYYQMFISYEGPYSFVLFSLERSVRDRASLKVQRISLSEPSEVSSAVYKIASNPMRYVQIMAAYGSFFCLSLLAIVGIFSVARSSNPGSLLLLCATVGILVSAPGAPPWDSDLMRAYAVTIPFMIALPAAGLSAIVSYLFPWNRKQLFCIKDYETDNRVLMVFTLVFVPFLCLSPILFGFQKNGNIPEVKQRTGQTEEGERTLWLVPGSQVIIRSGEIGVSRSNHVEVDSVCRNMGVLIVGYPQRAKEFESLLIDGNTLTLGYDMEAGALRYLVIAETETDHSISGPLYVYAEPVSHGTEKFWWKTRLAKIRGDG